MNLSGLRIRTCRTILQDLRFAGGNTVEISKFQCIFAEFLDNDIKEMLIRCSLSDLAAKFGIQLPVHFSLHDENSLASTLWSGVGRFVVMRLEINPNSEEALT